MSTDYNQEVNGLLSSQQSTQATEMEGKQLLDDQPVSTAAESEEGQTKQIYHQKQYFPPPNSKPYKLQKSTGAFSAEAELSIVSDALRAYQSQLQTISAQNKAVDQSLACFSEQNQEIFSQLHSYKQELEKCGDAANKFGEIDIYASSSSIGEMSTHFQSSVSSLSEASNQLISDAQNLLERKRKFESNLSCLEREERRQDFMRQKFLEAQSQLGIFSQSKRYMKKVQESDLTDLFASGKVSNVWVHLEGKEEYKEIIVKKSVYVKKLHVTGEGVKFLKINVQDAGCGITFSDCSFSRVGLVINGRYTGCNNGSVALVNVNVVDAPRHGIRFVSCAECSMTNSSVRGVSSGSGVVLEHVFTSELEGVEVEDCKLQGFYFDNSNAHMVNCTAAYCGGYAVCVKDNSAVTGNNVQFILNGGETIGKFLQK
eukprot:TRINITY_DN33897_c0_g1_i1.p1 TRINITY_DN33897_c0_g1~~TRINITY_DN33897_c0_g1_i1.p1  ORF type:complete len:428 (-),score=88.53 TRINITY_DN33897_c0_g1_i1:907-2190(-)